MKTWEEVRKELEAIQKQYTEKQFLDFLATFIVCREVERERLYRETKQDIPLPTFGV